MAVARHIFRYLQLIIACAIIGSTGSAANKVAAENKGISILATTSILGSIVSQTLGPSVQVSVLIPNGMDVHDWQPSAKDIEKINASTLVVAIGSGAEASLASIFQRAQQKGVAFFNATGHIRLRYIKPNELEHSERDNSMHKSEQIVTQDGTLADPHFWTDPVITAELARNLQSYMTQNYSFDVHTHTQLFVEDLAKLDQQIRNMRSEAQRSPAQGETSIPIITGHESLGYFADRYGLEIAGRVVPSLSTEAEASSAHIAELKKLVEEKHIKAIFTEIGTPGRLVTTLSKELKVPVITLATNILPPGGSYQDFLILLASTIFKAVAAS